MAIDRELIARLKMEFSSSGADKVIAEVKGLADAEAKLTANAAGAERAALSLENSFKRLESRYAAGVKEQRAFEDVQRKVNAAVAQNPALQERANAVLAGATRQFQAAQVGQKSLADSTKLTRYELINLSRQFQDVGVGLASGQGFGTVLIQQGTQIADVFAASGATLSGFFSQLRSGLAAILTPARLLAGGFAGIGIAAVAMREKSQQAQIDMTRALSGIGQASGATEADLVRVGRSVSKLGELTQAEGRKMASSFAAVGTPVEVLEKATIAAERFAAQTGTDAAEAAQKLAKAFSEGRPGIEGVLQQLGPLDDATRKYLRSLDETVDKSRLQAAGFDLIIGKTKEASTFTTDLGTIYNRVSQFFSNTTSLDKSSESLSDQITKLQEHKSWLEQQQAGFAGNQAAIAQYNSAIAATTQQVEKLTAAQKAQTEQTEQARAAAMAAPIREIVDATIPAIKQIETLTASINALQDAQRRAREEPAFAAKLGPERVAALGPAEQQQSLQRQTIAEAAEQQQRLTQETLKTAQAYGGVSIEVAKILQQQEQQLPIAEAVTGAEKIAAQEAATYAQLIAEGRRHLEASEMAAGQTAIALAQVESAAQLSLAALRDQEAVAGAVTGQERMAAQEQATFNDLIRQGVREATAMEKAFQQTANTQAQLDAGAELQLRRLQDQYAVITATTEEEKRAAEARATYNALIDRGVSARLAEAAAQQQQANAEAQAQKQENDRAVAMRDAQIDAEKASRRQAEALRAAALHARNLASAAESEADDRERSAEAVRRTVTQIAGGGTVGGSMFTTHITQPRQATDVDRYIATHTMTREMAARIRATGVPRSKPPPQATFGGFAEGFLMQGGSYQGLIDKLLSYQREMSGTGAQFGQDFYQVLNDAIRRIGEQAGPGAEIGLLQQEIARLQQTPLSFARDDLIKQLNDRIKELSESTDSLNDSMRSILSELYTTDPRLSKLGFRTGSSPLDYNPFTQPMPAMQPSAPATIPASGGGTTGTAVGTTAPYNNGVPPGPNWFLHQGGVNGRWWVYGVQQTTALADGGIMTSRGMLPLNRYQVGGIAERPQVAIFGEGSRPEAYVPLPDGRAIPVRLQVQGGANDNAQKKERPIVIYNTQHIMIQGDASPRAVSEMKITSFQRMQRAM